MWGALGGRSSWCLQSSAPHLTTPPPPPPPTRTHVQPHKPPSVVIQVPEHVCLEGGLLSSPCRFPQLQRCSLSVTALSLDVCASLAVCVAGVQSLTQATHDVAQEALQADLEAVGLATYFGATDAYRRHSAAGLLFKASSTALERASRVVSSVHRSFPCQSDASYTVLPLPPPHPASPPQMFARALPASALRCGAVRAVWGQLRQSAFSLLHPLRLRLHALACCPWMMGCVCPWLYGKTPLPRTAFMH